MDAGELKERTKRFAVRVLAVVDALPRTASGRAVGDQLSRSGPSVGANYRAACRARSKAEFIAKIGTVIEEADETAYWLELIVDARMLPRRLIDALLEEANEIVSIMTASRKTAQQRLNRQSAIGNRQ
jgi:four helix bundle protein